MQAKKPRPNLAREARCKRPRMLDRFPEARPRALLFRSEIAAMLTRAADTRQATGLSACRPRRARCYYLGR